MGSAFDIRSLEVILLIFIISILTVAAIWFYPILAVHYRYTILVAEEVKRLNRKYLEGLQVFNHKVTKIERTISKDKELSIEDKLKITTEMSGQFPDFAYLHKVFLEYFNYRSESVDREIRQRLTEGRQTFEQIQKEKIRELINVTAEEILEDSTYNLDSYEMPVCYCMLAVAVGIVVMSIPFLGELIPLMGSLILYGGTSLNLIWAAGGFVGAYIYSLYPLFQRYARRDLPPRAFLDYAIRVLLGPIVMLVLGNFILYEKVVEAGYQFSWAVIGGSMPFLFLNQARKRLFSRLGMFTPESVGEHDVTEVSGITFDYGERLHEEGIMNLQNLAFVNTEILSKRTMFNKRMLFDWKDEGILRLLAGNVPHKNFSSATESKETLYDKLREIGVNNVTALVNYLEATKTRTDLGRDMWVPDPDSAATKKLVDALGWADKDEYRFLLCKICTQGKEMLGEIEAGTTAYALSA